MKQLKRFESGVVGLDVLLKGGFIAGSSYMIQGRPGSGKTILANQIAFNHVRQGGRALFATLLAEPHERLFQFLSTLSFYDPSQVGQRLQFVSAFDTLENDGLNDVVKLLRREISRQKSSLLILDGLLNARSQAESPLDTKQFISELQGHAAFAGCTVIFLTSSQLDEGSPEHTMVDGVIEMGEDNQGATTVRRLRLRKTRGSGALSGPHEFEICEQGIRVYPRLESVFTHSPEQDSETLDVVTSGIPSLDERIGGGLAASSVTLALGPSGSGKTSLGLQFLSASTAAEPGLYFGFHESPQRIRLKARAVGHDFQALEAASALHLAWTSPAIGLVDQVAYSLLATVEQKQIKRVFIDSLVAMARLSADQGRVLALFTALMGELRARGVTVMAAWEVPRLLGEGLSNAAPDLSGVVDNLLLVQFGHKGAELQRQLSILKIRDSAYDPSLLEVVMNESGMAVRPA